MLTVYGAEWCEDTQRCLRYLRRLGVPHEYLDVDADPLALGRAKALNHGRRRTPVIQVQGEVLVEPGNRTLSEALVRNGLLDRQEASERIRRHNIGDLERGIRLGAGVALAGLAIRAPRAWRLPMLAIGAFETLTGIFAWCPVYAALGLTSIGGPLDHPVEADRGNWLAREATLTSPPTIGGQEEVEQ